MNRTTRNSSHFFKAFSLRSSIYRYKFNSNLSYFTYLCICLNWRSVGDVNEHWGDFKLDNLLKAILFILKILIFIQKQVSIDELRKKWAIHIFCLSFLLDISSYSIAKSVSLVFLSQGMLRVVDYFQDVLSINWVIPKN